MKKLLLILVAFVFLFAAVSCGDATDNPAETGNETKAETVGETQSAEDEKKNDGPKSLTDEEKKKFYKVVEFELPEGNFRDVLVDTMKKYASIKWVAEDDFGMKQDNGDWDVNLVYKKGTTYYGLPYTSYGINYDYFEDLIVDGKYKPTDTDWNKAPGVNCFSSIFISFQSFEQAEGGPYYWLPGHKDFCMEIVGDYKLPSNPERTTDILELNGKEAMFEAYTQMKKGDIVYTLKNRSTGNLHCRVLTEDPTIVKNGAGKLIPSRSSIKCIEQTNSFDKSRTDGVNTTWYIDHVYTFDKLYDTGYLPITVPNYNKPIEEIEVPYIGIDNEVTSSVLAKGVFNSTVKSNYPIRFIRVDILDKGGNVVISREKGDILRVFSFSLRNHFTAVFDELANGEYTFVLTAGISAGNVELARVDFTYNK